MSRLNITLCGVNFKNPVIAASGTYGFGREYNEFYPISRLGGISSKGMTIREKAGNPPPRIAETPSGILNSVGLQNPGVEHFIREDLPWLREQDTVIIANIAGGTEEDYAAIAERVNASEVDMVELNISCPNVKAGGAAFGTSCMGAERITSIVRERCPESAVRMVNEVYNAVKVPVIGLGGICTWQDAIEMTLAGASAIQVGTVMFTDPYAPLKIIDGMDAYLAENNISNISELIGQVQLW